jgi:hypothetical protein
MYQGVERRKTPRHQSQRAGVILVEGDSIIACMVRDFSPAGAGLLLAAAVTIPEEFELIFGHVTHHSVAVWRQFDRMGLKYDSRRAKRAIREN